MVTVAAVQATPAFLDCDCTVAKTVDLINEAARNGAELVAFPETWIPGYPLWLHASAAWEDPAMKRAYARLARNSLTTPGPATTQLCDAARSAGVTVVLGASERDNHFSGGTLYNTQLFFSPEGSLLGTRRKLMPTHAERMVWGRGDGSALQVHDSPAGRVGGLICFEHWMPLARFTMHSFAEHIHVASWPTVLEMDQLAAQHYAAEGRTFVLSVGAYMQTHDIPADLDLPDNMLASGYGSVDSNILMPGGTGIIGPDGHWLSGPIEHREQIVYADLDTDRILEEQYLLDTVGHYNRPDIFRLSVDTTAQPPIEQRTQPSSDISD